MRAIMYTYVAAPTVSAVSPNAGPTVGGTSVTITGTGFTGATAVSFGTTSAASFTVTSGTSITATSPAGSGTVDVKVTTIGGTSATGAADGFTYIAMPAVTGLAPASGPAAGGTVVTITGANLSGATAVKFGGSAAVWFNVDERNVDYGEGAGGQRHGRREGDHDIRHQRHQRGRSVHLCGAGEPDLCLGIHRRGHQYLYARRAVPDLCGGAEEYVSRWRDRCARSRRLRPGNAHRVDHHRRRRRP